MKDKLEPLTLITNVNIGKSKPELCYNYICQICEEQNSEEQNSEEVDMVRVRSICETCAKALRELIKTK